MSDPISPEYRTQMNQLAASLDRAFNGDAKGFKEILARFEGQPYIKGRG